MSVIIGIDAGGSTTKITGYREDGTLLGLLRVTAADPVTSVYGALGSFLNQYHISLQQVGHIALTGAGASYFENALYGISATHIPEFEAIGQGGLSLSKKQEAVVVSMGTGTAFIHADKNGTEHLGGSGIGGGTLTALCKKITGVTDYKALERMAETGDLSHVDLTIGDISKQNIGNLSAEITAANFGKVTDHAADADFVRGLYNMAFETIGTMAAMLCQNRKVKDIVLTGTLAEMPLIKKVLVMLEQLYPVRYTVPEHAAFATSIGAVLAYRRQQ